MAQYLEQSDNQPEFTCSKLTMETPEKFVKFKELTIKDPTTTS